MTARRAKGEGTVHFDAERQRWVGQVWVDQRRRKVTGRTKREVTDKLGKLRHADAAERGADRSMTVATLLTAWRTKAVPNRALSPSAVDAHDWAIAKWVSAIGSKRVADLRPVDMERALAKMGKPHPLSRASLVKVRSTMNQAMAWGVKRGDLARSPMFGVELPTELAPGHDKRALTVDEFDALCRTLVGHELEGLYLLSGGLGLRPGEAAGMTFEAVDLKAKVVRVIQSVGLRRGRPYVSDQLKTAKARRALEMRDIVADALRRHVKASTVRTGLMFTADDGGPVWPSTVRKQLAMACREAEIPVVSPNELRHTFCTHGVAQGITMQQMVDILGHTNDRMVQQYYRHLPEVIAGARIMDDPGLGHVITLRAG